MTVTLRQPYLSGKYPRNYSYTYAVHETSPSTIFERNESLCSYTMGQRFTLFASQAAVPFAFPLVIYQNNNLWLERKALKDKVEYRGYGGRCSTRVANYRHYLWRREGTAKNSDNGETRSAKTERERESKVRARTFFLPRGRDVFVNCFRYGRARLARVLD